MRKSLFLFFASVAVCFAQGNLLVNGGFDEKINTELFSDYTPGMFELTQFIEDGTWNKCLRVELKKITITKEGNKRVGIFMHFGRTGKQPGFKAKPNTIYQFSFDIKGDAPGGAVEERAGARAEYKRENAGIYEQKSIFEQRQI